MTAISILRCHGAPHVNDPAPAAPSGSWPPAKRAAFRAAAHRAESCTSPVVTQEPKRFVYVLQSVPQPGRQFIESAANVPMRLAAHNAGHSPLTASCRPWRLVAVVQFGTEREAARFERFLKTGAGRAIARDYFSR